MMITTPIPARYAELVPDRGPTPLQLAALQYFRHAIFPGLDVPEHLQSAVQELCDMGFMRYEMGEFPRASLKLKGAAFLEQHDYLDREDSDRLFMRM